MFDPDVGRARQTWLLEANNSLIISQLTAISEIKGQSETVNPVIIKTKMQVDEIAKNHRKTGLPKELAASPGR